MSRGIRVAASACHERHEDGELVAMPVAPFAEVVVAPMCFSRTGIDVTMIEHGSDFCTEGRAEALLQVDEYLWNKFRINLVSLAGPRHEKDIVRPLTAPTAGLGLATQQTARSL